MSQYNSEAAGHDIWSDEMTETRQFDWTGENTVTFAVVETVSAVTGQAVTEMQPLAQVIDAGALNTIFADGQTAEQSHFQIQFEYEDCLIRVTAGGEITATALHRF